jgi:hypothetical protein
VKWAVLESPDDHSDKASDAVEEVVDHVCSPELDCPTLSLMAMAESNIVANLTSLNGDYCCCCSCNRGRTHQKMQRHPVGPDSPICMDSGWAR